MAQQVERSVDQPGADDALLSLAADTAAYSGRLRDAREFSRRAMDSAQPRAGKLGASHGELARQYFECSGEPARACRNRS